MNSISELINKIGQKAKLASVTLRIANTEQKNSSLDSIANQIQENKQLIIDANNLDMHAAKKNNIDDALLDRLMLDDERLDAVVESLKQIANLDDPIGKTSEFAERPSGIKIGKMMVPLGVIGMIYESRPNVTVDAAALCIKSGNAVILRGGSEAINSNMAFYTCIKNGLNDVDLDPCSVQLIEVTDREAVTELVRASEYVDAIIPRGGKGLIKNISKNATVPVIKHLDGVCHTYLDKDADPQKGMDIAFNGKTRRYGVCNATETLLVHKDFDGKALLKLISLFSEKGVEIRGCEKSQQLSSEINKASESDWTEEYLAPILSMKIVNSVDEAIKHINTFGSAHTDAIVTENDRHSEKFLSEVDSSSVMVNVSTGFADGFEYGLGAEIGISTGKFHVRGPVGLEGLTSQKYIVMGDGQIRP
ncbi:glutamate-5-semialdehyde dehydrogenase [Candidatus Thioglobus sp.]|nr:glutamate-5-semialdehyde dehydrogenase [Candidatus Thioglobus sp.]